MQQLIFHFFIKSLYPPIKLYTFFIPLKLLLCLVKHFNQLKYLFIRGFKINQYLAGILVVLFVAGVCFLFSGSLHYKAIAFLLLMVLSLLSLALSIYPVITAAFLSAIIWNFFFIPPRFTFHVNSAEDFFLLLMYFVIAVVHAGLTFRIKQIEKRILAKEQRANILKLYKTLLNSLSHELRTPIATIIGATDNLLMSNDKLKEEDKLSLLKEVSAASLRLNQQVENLLNMSRLESGFVQVKKDWCDMNELVYATLAQLEEYVKKHPIQVSIPDQLPLFRLDIGLMEQVLYNLIYNATIYTPDGSEILIAINCRNKCCVIEIADSGEGFPAEEINKVFDKFYRVKYSRTGGTGLGLSIAKGFVEAHNGTISLKNVEEGGAKFTITIPTEISYLHDLKND
jgi:two-component system sensor histidine kinase KdpD